jgi:hypothetical protein
MSRCEGVTLKPKRVRGRGARNGRSIRAFVQKITTVYSTKTELYKHFIQTRILLDIKLY